jgi:hypothetical protein
VKGIISEHGIEGIEDISNLERPRAIAAIALLLQLLAGYLLSTPLFLIPLGVEAGEQSVRYVEIGTPLTSPSDFETSSIAEESPPPDTSSEALGADPSPEPDVATKGPAGNELGVEGAKGTDDVRIVSISPAPSLGLFTGDATTFEAKIEYNLSSAPSGTVTLRIEECRCAPDPGLTELTRFSETESERVYKGRTTLVLKRRVRMPAPRPSTQIEVRAVLESDNPAARPTNDVRVYGLQDNGTSVPTGASTVRIEWTDPDVTTLLREDSTVNFYIGVLYNLTSDVGTLHLTIEDSGSKTLASESARINKGQRKISFRPKVTIPAGNLTVRVNLDELQLRQNSEGGTTHATLVPVRVATDSKTYKTER